MALSTVGCFAAVLILSNGQQFLMPGPLTAAHSAIKNCSACHSKSGDGKLSWIHSLVSGDRLADSKACFACHKMPATAFFPHGASADVLFASTKRLGKIAAETPVPLAARAQSFAFPTRDVVARGLYCATCHQEHQGADFKLGKISNEQCRSCHAVKFDSFDGNHPQFDNYPFRRRTRIVYDHVAHFEKHFPDVAKKDPAKAIPATCSTCHSSSSDKRMMGLIPFDQTCRGCHLNQITGKERVSGPKGIAFLSLPGLDLQTLQKRSISVGEWPDASEAELTPFMRVMISRSEQGRALLKAVSGLNLQDLSSASDQQLAAVKNLVWEIKGLFYALISGKASDVLGNLNIGNGAKLSATLVADLTASIPRDVVISAQQQWLPHLAEEIAVGPNAASGRQSAPKERQQSASRRDVPSAPSETDTSQSSSKAQEETENAKQVKKVKRDPPACLMRVFGQCLLPNGPADDGAEEPKGDGGEADTAKLDAAGGKRKSSAADLPPAMRAGLGDVARLEEASKVRGDGSSEAHGHTEGQSAVQLAENKATKQSDDLLFPTEEELREIKARNQDSGARSRLDSSSDATAKTGAGAAAPQTGIVPVISIASDVDAESWAEYGGWYRQDYAIFYRPAGHKDKFIYSWLFLTGPQAPKGDKSPTAAVFDALTGKDAQGSCTKCHSIDDIAGRGRLVNFAPLSPANTQGRFTNFIHEPHFGVVGTRGCMTCHNLQKDRPYLKSYEQGDPRTFASNFGAVTKDTCQGCHSSGLVRQDCLTCHRYHVNGVITPILNTKIPLQ